MGPAELDGEPGGAPAAALRAPWRDNLEAAVMAVVLALFLKHFVVEAYRIPTGSMQPSLIGDESADVKDRILVDKLAYFLREPQRWDVAVFRYPLERSKSFVKRIAGVGPEELRIQHGDLWSRPPGGEWRIERRPAEVMREHWKRLDATDPDFSRWVPENLPLSSHWRTEGRAISAQGAGTALYRAGRESIVDEYLDGYPEALVEWFQGPHRDSGANPVGDLRVEGRVRAREGLERFVVVLQEGRRHYRFELPGPAGARDACIDAGPAARARAAGARPSSAAYQLPTGASIAFAVENLDDRLRLELEGEPFLELEIEPAEDQYSTVALQLEGDGAELEDLWVFRDLYYTAPTPAPTLVPAGHYFMLGDNTQDSSDSREWTFAVFDVERPDGSRERVRGNWRDRENPRAVAHGAEQGPLTFLVDEWGERHWFPQGKARRAPPEESPFVPRRLIQGRALAVFWPLDPMRGIFRLKWVH